MRHALLLPALALAAAACGRPDTRAAGAGGTVVISTASDADYLLPPLAIGRQGKAVADQIFDYLADIGPDMNTIGDRGFTPRLADRWSWAPDSLSIAFHLHPRARWHDGAPVRARDVAFTFGLLRDSTVASPIASLLTNVDSIVARDSATAVVWFHRRTPEQFFDVAYNIAILPEHLLARVSPAELKTSDFARRPVGSGRFRFARWDPGAAIEIVADTANYRGRPGLDRVIWTVSRDFTSATTQLLSGQADFLEVLRSDGLARVRQSSTLRLFPYPSLTYGYLGFNLRDPAAPRSRPHPIFADRGVRQALSMALDRRALVANVLDTLGAVGIGPVTRSLSTADETLALPSYDVARANRLLDSLGWRVTGPDGIRTRNGRPLAFTVLAPTSSETRLKMAVLIQEQLRRVGARVRLEQLEINAFQQRMQAGRFDTMLNAWQTDPSPATVRQLWGTRSASADNFNITGYSNPAFDALVDSASREFDPVRGKAYYRRAYETIVADAPAVWLYELRSTAGGHARLRITGMRADAWWAKLADWSIPPDQRIARDNIGLRVASRE